MSAVSKLCYHDPAVVLDVPKRISPVTDQNLRSIANLLDFLEAQIRQNIRFCGQSFRTGASARPSWSPISIGKAQLAHFHMKMLQNLLISVRFHPEKVKKHQEHIVSWGAHFSVFLLVFSFLRGHAVESHLSPAKLLSARLFKLKPKLFTTQRNSPQNNSLSRLPRNNSLSRIAVDSTSVHFDADIKTFADDFEISGFPSSTTKRIEPVHVFLICTAIRDTANIDAITSLIHKTVCCGEIEILVSREYSGAERKTLQIPESDPGFFLPPGSKPGEIAVQLFPTTQIISDHDTQASDVFTGINLVWFARFQRIPLNTPHGSSNFDQIGTILYVSRLQRSPASQPFVTARNSRRDNEVYNGGDPQTGGELTVLAVSIPPYSPLAQLSFGPLQHTKRSLPGPMPSDCLWSLFLHCLDFGADNSAGKGHGADGCSGCCTDPLIACELNDTEALITPPRTGSLTHIARGVCLSASTTSLQISTLATSVDLAPPVAPTAYDLFGPRTGVLHNRTAESLPAVGDTREVHPSITIMGKGFSSDVTGDGPPARSSGIIADPGQDYWTIVSPKGRVRISLSPAARRMVSGIGYVIDLSDVANLWQGLTMTVEVSSRIAPLWNAGEDTHPSALNIARLLSPTLPHDLAVTDALKKRAASVVEILHRQALFLKSPDSIRSQLKPLTKKTWKDTKRSASLSLQSLFCACSTLRITAAVWVASASTVLNSGAGDSYHMVLADPLDPTNGDLPLVRPRDAGALISLAKHVLWSPDRIMYCPFDSTELLEEWEGALATLRHRIDLMATERGVLSWKDLCAKSAEHHDAASWSASSGPLTISILPGCIQRLASKCSQLMNTGSREDMHEMILHLVEDLPSCKISMDLGSPTEAESPSTHSGVIAAAYHHHQLSIGKRMPSTMPWDEVGALVPPVRRWLALTDAHLRLSSALDDETSSSIRQKLSDFSREHGQLTENGPSSPLQHSPSRFTMGESLGLLSSSGAVSLWASEGTNLVLAGTSLGTGHFYHTPSLAALTGLPRIHDHITMTHPLSTLRRLSDATDPTSSYGWANGCFAKVRSPTKIHCDNVVVLLVHHLCSLVTPTSRDDETNTLDSTLPTIPATPEDIIDPTVSPVGTTPQLQLSSPRMKPSRARVLQGRASLGGAGRRSLCPRTSPSPSPPSSGLRERTHIVPDQSSNNSDPDPEHSMHQRRSTRQRSTRLPSVNEDAMQGRDVQPVPPREHREAYRAGRPDNIARKWIYIADSDLHDKGGFAKCEIPSGTRIAEYSGICNDSAKEFSSPKHTSAYVVRLKSGAMVDAQDPTDGRILCRAGFLNDPLRCDAANSQFVEENGKIFVYATKDILPNAEITVAYGSEYWRNSKWPVAILREAMAAYLTKHPSSDEVGAWNEIIAAKMNEEAGVSATGVHGPNGPSAVERERPTLAEVDRQYMTQISHRDNHLVFATWNSGSLGGTQDQVTHVADFFIENRIDCLVLQDTRCIKSKSSFIAAVLRDKIRGSKILSIPTAPSIQVDGQYAPAMGGTMVILSERASPLFRSFEAEKSGLGLVVRINFGIPQAQAPDSAQTWRLQVIAAYLPPKPGTDPGLNTMWSKLQTYIKTRHANVSLNPRQYLENKVTNWVHKSLARDHLTILLGDLNGVLEPGVKHRNISSFIRPLGLKTPFTSLLLPEEEYHTFYRQDRGVSRVDHILHSPMPDGILLSGIGVFSPPRYEPMFDHRPLWLGLNLATGYAPPPPMPNTKRAPRVEMCDDPALLEEFVHLTDTLSGPLNSAMSSCPVEVAKTLSVFMHKVVDVTSNITRHALKSKLHGKTVTVMQKGMVRRGNAFKDGYSPGMRLIQDAMNLHLEIRRKVARSAARLRWDDPTFQLWLEEQISAWERKHKDLKDAEGSPVPLLNLGLVNAVPDSDVPVDLSPTSLRGAPGSKFTMVALSTVVDKIRGLLHGRARARMREIINGKVKDLQEAYNAKRFSFIIRKLGYKETVPLNPHTLVLPTGEITTNPIRINENIMAHFESHHMKPSGLDSAAGWVHSLVDSDIQHLLLGQIDVASDPVANSNIPGHLLDLVLSHCKQKVTDDVASKVTAAARQGISFQDFCDAITAAKSNKAPGPSGLTINMIKALSANSKRFLYKAMVILWERKYLPQWMRDRMMALIPKKAGDPTLDNLRPIGLLEVLRKLWTGIIIRRIQAVWEANQSLHPSQHGYRWRNGTDHAIARAQNKIEAAKTAGTTMQAALWDIKAAFDSVPRPLMKLAWRRLGLPDDVADWITQLDEGGLTFPATPHVLLNQQHRDTNVMGREDGSFLSRKDLGFRSERGIIQGGTESALSWIALYDILLCIVSGPNGSELGDSLIAYADDLMSVTEKQEDQKTIADRLSAFCCFSGMQIAANKIQYVSLSTGRKPRDLPVHDLQWVEHKVPCSLEQGSVQYLGVALDIGGNGDDSFLWSRDFLSTALKQLESFELPHWHVRSMWLLPRYKQP